MRGLGQLLSLGLLASCRGFRSVARQHYNGRTVLRAGRESQQDFMVGWGQQDERRHGEASPPSPLCRRDLISAGLACSVWLGGGSRERHAWGEDTVAEETPVTMLDPSVEELKVTDRASMILQADGKPFGVLEFDLYGQIAPKAVENFVKLCSPAEGSLSYTGSSVFRVIPGLNIGMGDVASGGDKCVKSGTCRSAFGGPFTADPSRISHSVSGLVSMARGLGDTVDSRFFITPAQDAKWADGRYTAFGRLNQSGDSMAVLERLQALETSGTKNLPKKQIIISDCKVLQ
jgi:cyclophilin family peptidyl-prolyl cis-trans isomerase